MRFDRFTIRGQEAVQEAIGVAEKAENQQVEPEHLLAAMLEQKEGVLKPILGKIGANANAIANEITAAIGKFPKVSGGQQYFSSRTNTIFQEAQKAAEKMQDDYLSTVAVALPGIFVGSFLIEVFFSIPGLGREVLLAVNRSDYPVIQAVTIYIAVITMTVNLLTDVLYKLADPRVVLK